MNRGMWLPTMLAGLRANLRSGDAVVVMGTGSHSAGPTTRQSCPVATDRLALCVHLIR